jgi:uncharacterized protein YecT (DUF1311 family)
MTGLGTMRASTVVLAALLAGFGLDGAGPAAAADDPIAAAREACTSKEAQSEMNICSYALHKRLDTEMKRAYAVLLKRATAKADKANIRDAQKAWATYMTKHCTFQASGVEGGSAHPLIYNLCALDLTDARLKDLAYLASCEEGDLSCPYPVQK